MGRPPLRVWKGDNDWVIAESAGDAAAVMAEQAGYPNEAAYLAETEDEFAPLDDDKPLTLDEDGDKTTKTCAEWVRDLGRGHLGSRDF